MAAKIEVFCNTSKVIFQDYSATSIKQKEGVKLFKIYLPDFTNQVDAFRRFLSSEEKKRADRFYQKKDYDCFVICRTILKFLLAEETGVALEELQLNYSEHKKPYLEAFPKVFFNLSHSYDYAVIAIAEFPVGIDIEYVKNLNYSSQDSFLQHIFSIKEQQDFNRSQEREYCFYKFWTRKEALVKAFGTGIDNNFKNIEVRDGSNFFSHRAAAFQNWQIDSFTIHQSYCAAVAYPELKNYSDILIYTILPGTIERFTST